MSEPSTPLPTADQVAAVRRFNRFHTRLIGALDEAHLKSPYGLPQVRVLYEIAQAPAGEAVAAADLARSLAMDPGQLSRLIGGLEADGLVERSDDGGRRRALRLTTSGQDAYAALNAASASEIAALLAPLPPAAREEVVGAMARIRRLLGDRERAGIVALRDPRPGDLGWVTHRHGALYAAEYGWDWTFEALVAGVVQKFVETFDPAKDKCWIADMEGAVVGSVFLTDAGEGMAQLRLLYVEPTARGLGLGARLTEECLVFARNAGYRGVRLWTNDVLTSARRIYVGAGFELKEIQPHRSFGKDLVGEIWERPV